MFRVSEPIKNLHGCGVPIFDEACHDVDSSRCEMMFDFFDQSSCDPFPMVRRGDSESINPSFPAIVSP